MFVHAIRKPSFVILFVSLMLFCNATNGEEDSEKGNAQRPNVKQYTIEELLRTTSFVGASFSPDISKILKNSRVDEFTPSAEQQNTSIKALKIVETGEVFEDLASFDELMRNFLRENEIPGAALAVAKDGRLMYSRGFGYADVEKKQRVEPDSLFRIASISKPITATAIMRLVDEGRLKLDDRVFDLLSYKPHLPNGSEIDPRLKKITIRHLLQHTAGWDRDVSIDPMFHSTEIAHSLGVPTPAKTDDIIRFMMGWELDFDPGTRYAYSNFGYCLLGRVIENITKEDYEEHVRKTVLAPIGVHSTRIGKTLREGRANNEVCYYARGERTGLAVVGNRLNAKVPRPYGTWYLEAMDSHGAWIASAVDLARFGSAIQNNGSSKLVSNESLRSMFKRPPGSAGFEAGGQPKKRFYVCGWFAVQVGEDKYSYWHTGHLAGTSTILVLRHDGLCWAVLFNTGRNRDGSSPSRKIDPLVHKAADKVLQWPRHNLFK